MIEKHLYTSEEKKEWWGEGEWCNEPDFVEFTYKDHKCLIVRIVVPDKEKHVFGHLCGYVVTEGKYTFVENDYPGFDVHGGITFCEKKEDYGFCIGFDCAHSCDVVPSLYYILETENLFRSTYKNVVPSMVKLRKEIDEKILSFFPNMETKYLFQRSYKNIEFVIQELKSLVDQLEVYRK